MWGWLRSIEVFIYGFGFVDDFELCVDFVAVLFEITNELYNIQT